MLSGSFSKLVKGEITLRTTNSQGTSRATRYGDESQGVFTTTDRVSIQRECDLSLPAFTVIFYTLFIAYFIQISTVKRRMLEAETTMSNRITVIFPRSTISKTTL